jgi:hypothetical protein
VSLLADLGTKVKKGLQFVYGSAELDPVRDPMANLDREDKGQPKPAPEQAKDWDRG